MKYTMYLEKIYIFINYINNILRLPVLYSIMQEKMFTIKYYFNNITKKENKKKSENEYNDDIIVNDSDVENISDVENLDAHKLSVTIRQTKYN